MPESWRRSSATSGCQIPQEGQGKGQQHILVDMDDAYDMIHTHTYVSGCFRKGVLAVRCVGKYSSALPPCPLIC